MKSLVQNTIQGLIELNRLEEELNATRRLCDKKRKLLIAIESVRDALLPSLLLQHNRMRERGKRSVAAVSHGVCSACHMSLAIGNVNCLMRGDELRRCGNCGRYVYLAEESEALCPVSVMERRTPMAKAKLAPALATC
jgi:predicted  nucleic acid-binding Zn-ribbon protein